MVTRRALGGTAFGGKARLPCTFNGEGVPSRARIPCLNSNLKTDLRQTLRRARAGTVGRLASREALAPGAREAPHASRPSARKTAQPHALLRCARSAARLAPKRAPSSSAACPELKRAKSLGRPDHDPRTRWRPTRAGETGARLFQPTAKVAERRRHSQPKDPAAARSSQVRNNPTSQC
jgi:hypothetical protein